MRNALPFELTTVVALCEGYVAVDRVAGAIKLVDRLEFSRQNFTMPKGWN